MGQLEQSQNAPARGLGAALAGGARVLAAVAALLWAAPTSGQATGEEAAPATLAAELSMTRIARDIERFSALGSRAPGYPGNAAAREMILGAFQSAHPAQTMVQEFDCAVPVDKGASIRLTEEGGPPLEMFCMWPNRVRTPTLPPEGLRTSLVYCGDGSLEDLRGVPIEGNVALLEFDCGRNWLELHDLGAVAMVFLPPESDKPFQGFGDKFISVPANIPRFYVREEAGRKLKQLALANRTAGVPVLLRARMDWEKARTANIFARFKGSDEKLAKEHIVLVAYYDSMSIAPGCAPGAEQAIGVATLMELARLLAERPPKRSVVLMATSGHSLALAGARKFAYDLVRWEKTQEGRQAAQTDAAARSGIYDHLFGDADKTLFLALDISSHNDQLGMFVLGTFFDRGQWWDKWPKIKTAYSAFSEEVETRARKIEGAVAAPGSVFVNGVKTQQAVDYGIFFMGGCAPDTDVISATTGNYEYFHPALFFLTVRDPRWMYWSPRDLPQLVNYKNLERQLRVLWPLLYTVTSDETLPLNVRMTPEQSTTRIWGRVVWFDPRRSFIPDSPVPGAVIMHHPFGRPIWGGAGESHGATIGGVHTIAYEIADEDGRYSFDNVSMRYVTFEAPFARIEAYGIDPDMGEIIYAPDRGENGEQRYPALEFTLRSTDIDKRITAAVFRCASMLLCGLIDPRYLEQLGSLEVIDADSKTTPQAYGAAMPLSWPGPAGSSGDECAVIFGRPGSRVSALMGLGVVGKRFALINSSPGTPEGAGLQLDAAHRVTHTRFKVARDLWFLNDYRINRLAAFQIRSEHISSTHERARQLLDVAEKARSEYRHAEFLRAAKSAWAYESQVYADVKGIGDDSVRGVIFYLSLLLPFAFFAERLLFGFADIRRRVAAWIFTFCCVFVLFWFAHPAFRIAITPYIIFLAFVLLALSGIVMALGLGRFRREIDKLRAELIGIHQTDVSRTTAMVMAFALGVSQMRRRKLRTFMTCLTLMVLTFAITSFVSVRHTLKITKVRQPWKAGYRGLLLRSVAWQALNLEAQRRVKDHFGDRFPVAPRSWYVNTGQGGGSEVVLEVYRENHPQTRWYANGALGMSGNEPAVTGVDTALLPGKSRWFRPGERGVCILTRTAAQALGIGEEAIGDEKLHMFGAEFTLVGVLDESVFNALRDLDDEALTPVDYSTLSAAESTLAKTGEDNTGQARVAEYGHLPVDHIVLMPYEDVLAIPGSGAGSSGGSLRSVAVGFGSDEEGFTRAEEFIKESALTALVGKDGEALVFSSVGATSIRGFSGIFVPLLLATLMVFNTMLTSVYERTNQIATLNSVGLAPHHIAMLFLAESIVYGVVGGVVGYLAGQSASRVLSVWPVFGGLELNYSSTSVIMATCVVLGVVLLAALYPARQAAKMAVPEIQRRWILPRPIGDRWEFTFPFTVRRDEALGLNTFLIAYFQGMSSKDIGGNFTVQDLKFAPEGAQGFLLSLRCWLAPYDLAVSQEVALWTHPMPEIPENMQLTLRVKRLSGEVGSWTRVNRPFLNDFRKQFLLWKTVSREDRNRFIKRGAVDLGAVAEGKQPYGSQP